MLDYTKAAGKKILSDLQKISRICSTLTQLFYIFYLIFAVCTDTGILFLDIIMLILSCSYFAFFCYHQAKGVKTALTKNLNLYFRWSKRTIKLFNLLVMTYGIIYAASSPDPLSVILTVVMALLWIADILLEVSIKLVKSWWDLFFEGIQADLEVITKPAGAVNNFFKRMAGKEVEEAAPPTQKRIFLDGLVQAAKDEKKDKKQEEKLLRKQAKQEKAEQKRQKKAEAKAAKQENVATEEVALSEDNKE